MFQPPIFNPDLHARATEVEVSVPFGGALRHAIEREFARVPLVSGLLEAICPAAVFFAVISINIYAIHGMSCAWAEAHVRDEVYEPAFAKPAIAYLYSAPSVALVGTITFIEAASFESAPRSELGALSASWCVSMRGVRRPLALPKEATARGRMLTDEMHRLNDGLFSAVALTAQEKLRAVSVLPTFRQFEDDESSVTLTNVINFLRHNETEHVVRASAVNT